MHLILAELEVHDDRDIGRAGQQAWAIAAGLGFGSGDQLGIASAASGLAGAVARRDPGGHLELCLEGEPAGSLVLRVVAPESGEGQDLDRLLLDDLRLVGDPGGPGRYLAMTRPLPRPISDDDARRIARDSLASDPSTGTPESPRRDAKLAEALDHLESQGRELARVRRELEETHRGVLALHRELADRAESLQRAGDMKTRFLANVSHQLRTPLSSILSLARLLLDRADGELSTEQDRQVTFILRSAQDLAGMVEELLDLARIEGGREVFHPTEVDLSTLFGALRGMLLPLVGSGSSVALIFEEPAGLPPMVTDESKLSQVLRNFLSNALKFTEQGEIRLRAEPGAPGMVVFSVTDTGIGIASEHLHRIFEEFAQLESPLQRQAPHGTGLGLPLARKLARLLGGEVHVRSEPGVGSTFSATIPARFPGQDDAAEAP